MKKIHFIDVTLVFLIILSLVLTGSLWFDNYHGLSLVMAELPFLLNDTFEFDNAEYTDFIKPYKVTLTNNDSGNYIYYAFSEGNIEGFNTIASILNQITNLVPGEAIDSEWNELIARKSIICEFGGLIDTSLLKSAMNNSTISIDIIPNISAIAITKSLTGVTIYIKNDEKIFRFSLEGDITEFDDYLTNYSKKTIYSKFVKLSELGTTTFYGNKKVSENSYVLFPMSAKQDNRRYVSEIVKKNFFDNYDISTLEKLVTAFFSTNEYTKFTTTDDSYIFIKDDGSTIKVQSNGIFEYIAKELEVAEDSDSTIVSSFNIALDYINNIGDTDIYLLSATEINDTYEFKFAINKDELPVINTECPIDDDNKIYTYIKVKDDKLIYCKQSLNRFETIKTTSYISSFGTNILDDIVKNFGNDTIVTVKELDLVYDVSKANTFPFWYSKYKVLDNDNYTLTVAAKKKMY